MKKRILLATLLLVPMSIAIAVVFVPRHFSEAKDSAMQALTEAKLGAAKMREAATTTAKAELKYAYIKMAEKTASAVEALTAAVVAETYGDAAVHKAAEESKKVLAAIRDIVTAIKTNNVAEASAKATDLDQAIEEMTKAVHAVVAPAKAVKEAVADIKAAAR